MKRLWINIVIAEKLVSNINEIQVSMIPVVADGELDANSKTAGQVKVFVENQYKVGFLKSIRISKNDFLSLFEQMEFTEEESNFILKSLSKI